MIVTETNNYARSKFTSPGYHKDFDEEWVDVSAVEMGKFFGLMMFMGRIRSPGKFFILDIYNN